MSGEFFIIAGGLAAAAVIAFILIRCRGEKKDISSATDDQLVVTQLTSSDITGWFKEKNPDGKYTNIVMLANSDALTKMNLPKESVIAFRELIENSSNGVIQAIVDTNNDDVILTRAVIYDTMTEKLEKLFNDNNGVIILE